MKMPSIKRAAENLGLINTNRVTKLNITAPTDVDILLSIEFRCDECDRPAQGVMFGKQLCDVCAADKIERGI